MAAMNITASLHVSVIWRELSQSHLSGAVAVQPARREIMKHAWTGTHERRGQHPGHIYKRLKPFK